MVKKNYDDMLSRIFNDCIQFPNSVNDTDERLVDLVAYIESLMHHNITHFGDIWVNRYTKDRAYNEYSGIAALMMFLHAYWYTVSF